MKRYLSSEYVGIGHPDKVADQISDTILDMYLSKDPMSRVAAETLVSGNRIIVAGEISSHASFSDDSIKRSIIDTVANRAGYDEKIPCQFRKGNLDIQLFIKPQSTNIHEGVDKEDGNIGAGDQGIMFGYATKEHGTEFNYLPIPYVLAADILSALNFNIMFGTLPGIYTDNKSQVCCLYENGNLWIEKIILSSFHDKKLPIEEVRDILKRDVMDVLSEKYSKFIPGHPIELLINSAGPFWIGGPEADAGVTGRKIIVDTYGGFAPHGGGAFSGKDPSKVDRSAAYMARHIAKNIVANGFATEALVQLSYAIGQVHPFSISIKSDSKVSEEKLVKLVEENFDLSPRGIINYLQLTNSNIVEYKAIAGGGHFLFDEYPWEQIKTLTNNESL